MGLVALTTFDIAEMRFMGIRCQTLGQFCHLLITFMTGKALSRCHRLERGGFAVAIPAGCSIP